eukprot:TRINITY_DN9480_c0_g1_i2.p1 TRINITY_DN9480_c0_g1~~TRINITY_DN9480_c0_g1_i2.p1  ORF type:complete len:885 (+),score=311.77 TRINITY_DN9480_c0_g1_i2:64-2718(+)
MAAVRKRKREAEPLRNDVFKAITAVGAQRVGAVGGAIHRAKEAVATAAGSDEGMAAATFVKCVVGIPQRATAYAAALRAIADDTPEFARRVVDGVLARWRAALEVLDWHGLKTCIRFLGYLASAGVVPDVTPAVARLLREVATGGAAAPQKSCAARHDSVVYTVLSVLPWLPDASVRADLLPQLAQYFQPGRRARTPALAPRRPVHVQQYAFAEDPKTQTAHEPDLLDVMYEEVAAAYAAGRGANGLACRDAVLVDYTGVYKAYLRENGVPGRHNFNWKYGDLNLDVGELAAHCCGAVYADIPCALQLFSVREGRGGGAGDAGALVFREMASVSEKDWTFGQEDELWFDQVDAMPFLQRLMVRELAADVLHCFHADKDLACRALADLGRGAAAAACVVDAVLGCAFTVPAPPLPLAFYSTLLVALCKDAASPYALPTVAAFDTLCEQAPMLDAELTMRLNSLFTALLANSQFKWAWAHGDKNADHRAATAQKLFNFELMHSCTRTCSKALLAATPMAQMDKSKVFEEDGSIRYKFRVQGLPFKRSADCLLVRLRSEECGVAEVVDTLKELAHEGKPATPKDRADVLVNCLLFLGSDSVAHQRFLFRQYAPALKACQAAAGQGLPIMQAVAEFWDANPHQCVVTMSILIQLAIVTPLDVVGWLFTDEIGDMYERSFLWEIVYMVFDHLTEKVRRGFEELVDLEGAMVELDAVAGPEAVKERARKQLRKKTSKLHTQVTQTYLCELRAGMQALFEGLSRRIRLYYKREKRQTRELLASGDETRQRRAASKNFVWCRAALGHLNAVGRKYLPYLLPFVDELYEGVLLKAKVPTVVMNIFFSWRFARGRRAAPDVVCRPPGRPCRRPAVQSTQWLTQSLTHCLCSPTP